ncbi:MAG: carboxypeptidase-like regulatory domain-containing protein [Ferruginibacter sp.]|nr:carboxypeptidase-like regulatory domain-containing protein [Ferruginibacter sp.]
MRILIVFLLLILCLEVAAQKIYGTVFNDKGDLLPFSSITIKGTSIGASANNNGKFSFSLSAGNYTLVCQHIGYAASEKSINVQSETEVTFILSEQKLVMKEVVVKSNAEDPAYEIIRQAIKKRSYYSAQVDAFTCNLYGKDLIKLRSLPSKILGRKIPAEDRKGMGVDSTGKGVIYLSESVSKVSAKRPDKFKLEVMSSRVSGSGSFGFTFPAFISLYKNNVTVFSGSFNPRGFVSPIADGALKFYRYKFLGTFFEDGKAINTIRVIPRRNYEPLFSGIINITDEDWRIHSFDLTLTKLSQLEIMDTLQITQLYVPVSKDIWRVKNQLLHFNFSMFKIDAVGNFLTVYSDYNLNPTFGSKFFNNVVIKYDTAVDKKSHPYWDSIRPVPLEPEELKDYRVKDSVYLAQKDSLLSTKSIDSLKKMQGKIMPLKVFWNGIHRTHYSKTNTYQWGVESLIRGLEYNPAEGIVTKLALYFDKYLSRAKANLSIMPNLRYGFANTHLNAWLDIELRTRDLNTDKKIKRQAWFISGGKRVTQFNKENPIAAWRNSVTTLGYGDNYMKTYENYFAGLGFSKRYESGLRFSVSALYEDRIPLNNTTTYTIYKKDSIRITPNFPVVRNLDTMQFNPHQAVNISFDISFKPGQKYIQLPNSKVPLGSKYPTFGFNYTKGISGILGSDVNFDKWKISIYDDKNLKLAGTLKYRASVGGFINTRKVYVQDYTHFKGNQSSLTAGDYLSSFQLLKYYEHSNVNDFFVQVNLEHHFNGLITNKIPLFKKLNWNLVGGGNAFYVKKSSNYGELFVGLENIIKVLRLDFVAGFENGKKPVTGIKLGGGGLLGAALGGGSRRRRGAGTPMSF